jgi:glucokinase
MSRNDKQYVVGFDLGGTKMMAVVFDRNLKPVSRVRRKTKAQNGPKAGVARMAETIRMAIRDAGLQTSDLAGIGIAAPGPLDLNRGILLDLPNLGWKNVRLKEILARKFGKPVMVANDVDAGTYGEYRCGAGKGARCVFGIFPGTGIGGGCVYNGNIIRGRRSSCMEIGHCQVVQGGLLCGCGRRGCLETVASRVAVSSAVAAAVCRGKTLMTSGQGGSDVGELRSSVIAGLIRSGDKVVEQIVRDAAAWLGVGISIAVNMLAPDVVVLGGGLVEALPGIYLKESEKSARSHVMPSLAHSFKVVTAKLGDDACASGAAALAGDAFFVDGADIRKKHHEGKHGKR